MEAAYVRRKEERVLLHIMQGKKSFITSITSITNEIVLIKIHC